MDIGPEIVIEALAEHAGHDLAVYDEGPDVDTGTLGDEFLDDEANALDVEVAEIKDELRALLTKIEGRWAGDSECS